MSAGGGATGADPLAHLRSADPVLAGLLARIPPEEHVWIADPGRGRAPIPHYAALVRAITGQQLSVKAAQAINGRLVARFGGRLPTPEEVLADDPEALKAGVGLSRAKVGFLRSLAEHVRDGTLELDRLDALDDTAVAAELVAVKGIGAWTADMFLMGQLGRPDVLAVGDLGIRRGAELAYGLPALPSPAELTALAERWRPHRSAACRLLWASLDVAPEV